jgi:hypothetical protein
MITSCDKCWSMPCTCGYDYKSLTVSQIRQMILQLQARMGQAALEKYDEDNSWNNPGLR